MLRLTVAALLVGAAMPAAAATWTNSTSGLSGTFTAVNLAAPTLASETLVTTQYTSQGITFANATYDPQPGYFPISIGNFASGSGIVFPNIRFAFNSGVTAVAFRYISNDGASRFDAFRGSTLVASAFFDTSTDPAQWYSVTGGGFNRIVIDAPDNNALLVADFQIAGGAVPEPASWALLIAGFAMVGVTARRRRTVVAA